MIRRPPAKTLLAAACALGAAASNPVLASGALETFSMVAGSTVLVTPVPASMLGSMISAGMKLGSWREYTRQALLPDFGGRLGFRFDIDLGLLADHEHLLLPGFAQVWDVPETSTRITLDLGQGFVSDQGGFFGSRVINHDGDGMALERVFLAPGLRREFNNSSAIDVAAVLANQRFSSWGLGTRYAWADRPMASNGLNDLSAGTGLWVGVSSEVRDGLALEAAVRSRIDMDPFPEYRGVYSEPGDFDIPASANVGVVLQAGERAFLSFDVERILYSEVNAFTTRGLPDRFLSLLGDAGSPEFGWQDLTVYSVGWNWQASEKVDWRIRYSTRQQPTPTSEALKRALEPDIADSNLTFGFSRQTGRTSRVDFNASYAPSEYFLGPTIGRAPDLGEEQFEFEVRLVWDF